MVALAHQTLPYRSFHCSLTSKLVSNHPQVRHVCFSVSSVLSSPSLVDQSSKFREASKSGNLIPLHQCIFSDHLTPVLAYRCLVNENDHETPSFLLESVNQEMQCLTVGRYSVLGAKPSMEVAAKGKLVIVRNHHEGWKTKEVVVDALVVPQRIMESWIPQCLDELPPVFCGGWFGYFSDSTTRYTENRLASSRTLEDDTSLPDMHLSLYDDILVFDHVEKKIYVIHWVQLDRFPSTEAALDNGVDRLESLLSRVHNIVNPRLCAGSIDLDTQSLTPKLEASLNSREAYRRKVLKAKEHVLARGVSEIVISQQFQRRTFSDPFEVYRALRVTNPSPLMAYMQVRSGVLVATSPEILTCVGNLRKITKRSRAGTTDRRCRTIEKGGLLVNGTKHYKEHDERINNSVQKRKAMDLIDELEGGDRGSSGGSFGCISFSGEMNVALASKTIVFPSQDVHDTLKSNKNVQKLREWTAFLQGGASIMADSDPRDIERVCESEAAILARAIDLAESSFSKS